MTPFSSLDAAPFPLSALRARLLATVSGQLLGMTVGFFLVSGRKDLSLSPRRFRPSGDVIRDIYRIGLPAIVMQSLAAFMTLGLNKIMALFSESAVFILGVYFKIQSFIFMPVFGLNNGSPLWWDITTAPGAGAASWR